MKNIQGSIPELLTDRHVEEVIRKATEYFNKGSVIYFKWTCGGCGKRLTSKTSNTLRLKYMHFDCGFVTDTVNGSLGFAALVTSGTLIQVDF